MEQPHINAVWGKGEKYAPGRELRLTPGETGYAVDTRDKQRESAWHIEVDNADKDGHMNGQIVVRFRDKPQADDGDYRNWEVKRIRFYESGASFHGFEVVG